MHKVCMCPFYRWVVPAAISEHQNLLTCMLTSFDSCICVTGMRPSMDTIASKRLIRVVACLPACLYLCVGRTAWDL